MIMSRLITNNDYDLLATSLLVDEYHSDTPPSFFYEPNTVCNVYEDELGPILFVRGQALLLSDKKFIRLDIQYLDNNDGKRNLKAMIKGFPELESNAKSNGFSGFIFESTAPLLRAFCIKRLGFKEGPCNLLVKVI